MAFESLIISPSSDGSNRRRAENAASSTANGVRNMKRLRLINLMSPTLVVNLPKFLYPYHSTNRGSCV
jgi:hypothetical protein